MPWPEAGPQSLHVVPAEVVILCTSPFRKPRSPRTRARKAATVVCKLFNMMQPNVAFFGQKDFQQCAVVHRMTLDLNFPIEIVTVPTVPEPDGLAMSSRNRYLAED